MTLGLVQVAIAVQVAIVVQASLSRDLTQVATSLTF